MVLGEECLVVPDLFLAWPARLLSFCYQKGCIVLVLSITLDKTQKEQESVHDKLDYS